MSTGFESGFGFIIRDLGILWELGQSGPTPKIQEFRNWWRALIASSIYKLLVPSAIDLGTYCLLFPTKKLRLTYFIYCIFSEYRVYEWIVDSG
jgi:hypothetical protein